jgi:pyruvate/2-oxoacid:ferredoxin oxidoreductase beta subunit
MELKAQYDLDDLMDLVEKDLEAKGFRLVVGLSPVINGGEALLLTLAIQQLELETKAKELAFKPPINPDPTTPPASAETLAAKGRPHKSKGTNLNEGEKEKQEAKRAYWRDQAKKKRELAKAGELAAKQTQSVPEVVAPTTVPFQLTNLVTNNGLSTGSY